MKAATLTSRIPSWSPRIMAGFGADDQMLCAAILHDTVQYSYATLTALQRKFGSEVATMVSEALALKHLGGRPVPDVLAALESADRRVLTLKVADRLHNMRTVEFLRLPKQLFKARETLDIFAPTAEVLRLPAVGTELQRLAFGTLVRSQSARPPCTGPSSRSTLSALPADPIRSRPAADHAVRAVRRGIAVGAGSIRRTVTVRRSRGRAAGADLSDPAESSLVSRIAPKFARLLAGYNAGAGPQHRLRVRMVVHAGEVHYDGHGCFGVALDTAFRLLEAPAGKRALARAKGPLLLVVSDDVGDGPGRGRVSVDVGGHRRRGWISLP